MREKQVDTLLHKKTRRQADRVVRRQSPPAETPTNRPLASNHSLHGLAVYYEDLIRNGHVHDYAEIATRGHVTRARVTQIMNLRLLAPEIQESLLTLPRVVDGRDELVSDFCKPLHFNRIGQSNANGGPTSETFVMRRRLAVELVSGLSTLSAQGT